MKYVRLYGSDHKRTHAQFEATWNELKQAVPKGKSGLVVGVSNDHLLVDGVVLEAGNSERSFAQLLTASGLTSIQFFSDVTSQEFAALVNAFAFSGSKAQDLADQIKNLFPPEDKGNIRINEVKFVAADPAIAVISAAAQIAAQSLGPEYKEWINDPGKLVQLIAAAEGAKNAHAGIPQEISPAGFTAKEIPSQWANQPFLLDDEETIQALQLITRFGELGAGPSPKPELVGVELHHSDEKVKNSVLSLLAELSKPGVEPRAGKPILMRAAEQLAIRYAMERFESGDLKVNAVHDLLESMGQQMGNLRKILQLQEDKMVHAGLIVESHGDILDRMFWAELPETSKKKALLSEDASCVPPRNLRQYVELLLQRSDRETASAILANYAAAIAAKDDLDYRARAATGITQLADLYVTVGGTVLSETTQKLGDAISKEPNPEIESLLSAAFVRLTCEASERKQYLAVAQACEAMDYVATRRPALEKELRSRIGVEARLPEIIEDAMRQQRVPADLISVLRRNSDSAAEHLAERFFRSMRREA
ncbi:MAG TPA: hypothetical protein VIL63_07585, partial [Terriglobales bacterium]